jgi:putative tricarboxylic transport membrane protein
VATCFDAYPLSKKGETVRALGVGILASFVGTVGSIVIATFVSPLIANLAVKLGPWEYFSLCLCSLVLVSTLAKGNMFKGLAGACIGILLSCIGSSPIDGYLRFSYGNIYLSGGIDMVALMLGIFAIKQIVVDYARGQQEMPEVDVASLKGFNIPIKDFLQNKMNIFRSFMIGLWIGFLPGMGAGLSNMVAYAQAKSSSKTPEAFGEGCVDGIFASEVSNNAAVGGAVIPMIALGIPGDAVTALLLSGLMIHGLQPGPLLYINNPDTV